MIFGQGVVEPERLKLICNTSFFTLAPLSGIVPQYNNDSSHRGRFPVNNNKEQVVITVLGANNPGILAGITRTIADSNVNVEDVSQKIMQDLFALMMMTDFSSANCSFEEFQNRMQAMADQLRVKVFIQHEDVFRYQHRL